MRKRRTRHRAFLVFVGVASHSHGIISGSPGRAWAIWALSLGLLSLGLLGVPGQSMVQKIVNFGVKNRQFWSQ